VPLCAAELLVLSAPVRCLRGSALGRGLALVMPTTERRQVGLAMVITSNNVIHVARRLRAPHTVLIAVGALVAVSAEDPASNGLPVGRKARAPIRTDPLRHEQSPSSGTWMVGAPATCAERGVICVDPGLTMGAIESPKWLAPSRLQEVPPTGGKRLNRLLATGLH